MILFLLLVFVAAPVLEIYVGSLVVDTIGFGAATLLLLAAVLLGAFVMRLAWRRRPRTTDSAFLMTAGVLLLLPGYVSDVVALLLLLPPVRALLRVWIGQRVNNRLASWNLSILRWDESTGRLRRADVVPGTVTDEQPADGRIVQGEIVQEPRKPPGDRT